MARARNIKPGFFKNEELVELPFESRLLFIGLWTLSDREGRLEDRPKRIKMEVFPADAVDVDAMLDALQASGFIVRYQAGDIKYIQCLNFTKHQNPHIKEPASTIPAPDKNSADEVLDKKLQQTSHADSLIPDSPSLKPLKSIVGQKPDLPPGFVRFWTAWPSSERKQGRGKCVAIWKRKSLEPRADAVVAHVEKLAKSESWKSGFDPMPTTYLNEDRWDGADLDTPLTGEKHWTETWSGILGKASELGVLQQEGESAPDFKLRILNAAEQREAA